VHIQFIVEATLYFSIIHYHKTHVSDFLQVQSFVFFPSKSFYNYFWFWQTA